MKSFPEVSVIDNYTLALPSERMLAFLIDYLLAFGLFFIPFVGPSLSFLYLVFRDGIKYVGFKSLGKFCFRVKVINEESNTSNLWISLKRNFIFLPNIFLVLPYNLKYYILILDILLIMLEVYFLFTNSDNQRLGDQIADTVVIKDDLN